MLKSLHSIKLIAHFLREKEILPRQICDIGAIYQFFIHLQNHKSKFYALYIYNYLFAFISSDEVAKRKTSARIFEDLLAALFGAEVADTKGRKNLAFEVGDYFLNVKDKIASNRREKADVIFPNLYAFSVKTLIAKNSEINMGSFEKRVLFDGLRVDNCLQVMNLLGQNLIKWRSLFIAMICCFVLRTITKWSFISLAVARL